MSQSPDAEGQQSGSAQDPYGAAPQPYGSSSCPSYGAAQPPYGSAPQPYGSAPAGYGGPAPYQSVVQVKHLRSPGPEHGASSNISRFVGQTWL